VKAIQTELAKKNISREQVGMNPSAGRTSLPIQAGEQIPMPENFATQLAAVASTPDAKCQVGFADLYLRKTVEEIEAIRRANRVANVGLQAFFENSQPGNAECEIAAAVESVIYCQIGHDEIFHSRGWAMVQSGPNSACAGRFNRSTARRVEDGNLVVIELATCVNGYWSDLTRTAAVGSLKDEVAEVFSVAQEAQRASVAGIHPGARADEIDSLARNHMASNGFEHYFTHHTGHHVGFRYHDPGFLIAPGFCDPLEPGMVVTIEPGVYIPERGAGARIEDDVLVTESGHEVLSASREFAAA
jgi:Xaa-Pro aminopeptidase